MNEFGDLFWGGDYDQSIYNPVGPKIFLFILLLV